VPLKVTAPCEIRRLFRSARSRYGQDSTSVCQALTEPAHTDGDGHHIHNLILLGLPLQEGELISPKLEFVRLKTHQVLHEPGDSLKSAYFCDSGLVSILCVFPDGKSVEVGLVGKEGFVGVPLVAGFRTSATRAIAQIEATAFRVDGETLLALLC